jgi:predicted nucleic acid-binding protein
LTEIICNTSPLQYLHQIGQLPILSALAGRITVPSAVVHELATGLALGVDVPRVEQIDWITVRVPQSSRVLGLVQDLDPGETAVLALALESTAAKVILDDAQARRVAQVLGIPLIGTLGLLQEVRPLLDQLQRLNFRLSRTTRQAVLKLAGESERKKHSG